MSDPNSAFLWETEPQHTTPQRVVEGDAEGDTDNDRAAKPDGRWVTLREASRATDIPVETLRKWARRATIPTYLMAAPSGTNLRMVDLEGVEQRAAELGRAIHPTPESPSPPREQPTVGQPSGTPPESQAAPVGETSPPGTLIVPVDAWNRMLNQLGNLHEAGQQLAVARERAAKAETEATFLRERLAELRREATVPTPPPEIAPETAPEIAPETTPSPPRQQAPPTEKVWQYFVRRVRDRR